MPARRSKQALFIRWLWLVYLPLGLLAVTLPLAFLGVLSGGPVWLVGLLAVYCVIPARLLLETRRKGLELPMPPRSGRRRSSQPPPGRQSEPASAPMRDQPSSTRVARSEVSPRIRRRRALAGMVALVVVAVLGVILFLVGMGQAGSGRLGLALMGVGIFLMLLSVTVPTFKIVDMTIRGIGRLIRKSPNSRSA